MKETHQIITEKIINTTNDVQAILLKGSHLKPDTTDFWSDVDLTIILKKGIQANTLLLDALEMELGTLIGREMYHSEVVLLNRLAMK